MSTISSICASVTISGGDSTMPSRIARMTSPFSTLRSRQIVPTRLYELLSDPDPTRAQAATAAMMQMQKIVIADLEAAADAA